MSHRDTEQRLLDQRTGEAGAVLSTAISALQTPLTSAAELASATNGDPSAFEAVMAPLAGTASASWRHPCTPLLDVPLVNVGQPTVMNGAGAARTKAMLDQAAGASQLAVVDLLDLPGRHLGYAFRSSEQPARYVVYAEVALPPRTSASRTTGPFQDLNYATYLENGQAGDELLYASVAERPDPGRTARTVVPFGDRQLVLVTTTSVSLGGQLSRALRRLIALVGAALVILGDPRRGAAPTAARRGRGARRRCVPPLRGPTPSSRDPAAQPAPARAPPAPRCDGPRPLLAGRPEQPDRRRLLRPVRARPATGGA